MTLLDVCNILSVNFPATSVDLCVVSFEFVFNLSDLIKSDFLDFFAGLPCDPSLQPPLTSCVSFHLSLVVCPPRVHVVQCERIRKKRGAFLGSLRVAHTTSIDDTDQSIMAAR